MQAVGHALANKGMSKVNYVTSEQFTNDLVSSLRSKTVGAFKEKYRKVGALLVDDVQFFAGKESSQEEFFNTFNVLYQNGVQIVLTSDRKPQDIDKLEQRLVSRFLGGLTVDGPTGLRNESSNHYQESDGGGSIDRHRID